MTNENEEANEDANEDAVDKKTYGLFDADGLPKAFWHRGLGQPDPAAIEISEDQWQEFLSNQGLRRWDNGKVVPYEPPPTIMPPPESLSRRQFAEQLAIDGAIGWDEAITFAGGTTLPKVFANAVATLPIDNDPNARNKARLLILTCGTFDRHHPFTPMLGRIVGKDEAGLDAFWKEAGAIV